MTLHTQATWGSPTAPATERRSQRSRGPPPGCRSPAAGVLTRYPPVELYAKNTCPFAQQARQFFEGNRIAFQLFDVGVDSDAAASSPAKRAWNCGIRCFWRSNHYT